MDETIPKADITELLPPISVSTIQERGFSADHNPADNLGKSYTLDHLTGHVDAFMTFTQERFRHYPPINFNPFRLRLGRYNEDSEVVRRTT